MLGNKGSKEPKILVSVGGGATSTIDLPLRLLETHDPDEVDFFICALKGESPDLWRMVDWLEKTTGKHVYRVAWSPHKREIFNGLHRNYKIDPPTWMYNDIWDVFFHTRFMGNSRIDPCSRVLKRETSMKFITDFYAPEHTTLALGITADEIDRTLAITARWGKSGFKTEYPLIDNPPVGTKQERCLQALGFIPFLYSIDFDHNNCGGFCVKSGHKNMAKLLRYAPEIFAYHEKREKQFRALVNATVTIMRDTERNFEKYGDNKYHSIPLTLEEFRIRMENKWKESGQQSDMFTDLNDTPACKFCDAMA